MAYGVIGNTTDFGSVFRGSSPLGLTNRVCGVIGNISHCHCEVRGSSPPYPATQHPTEKSTRHSGVSGKWRENSVGLGLVLKTKGAAMLGGRDLLSPHYGTDIKKRRVATKPK